MSAATTPVLAVPLMTAAEFLAKHGDESGVELVKGKVVRLPKPGGEHGRICGNAYFLLRQFVQRHDLGRLMTNDTYIQVESEPDTYRGADVCYLSYSRLPKEEETPSGPIPAPDLVVEVRSPSDRLKQLSNKAYGYLEAGVTVVVALIPETKLAAIFRNDQLPITLGAADELTLPDILPGFSAPVKSFFE